MAIVSADGGVSAGPVKQLFSDKELRDALASLDYTIEEVDNILEILADKGAFWKDARVFDESAVATLGF